MVLAVLSSDGKVMAPYFFAPRSSVNATTYLNVLTTVVKPWIDDNFGGVQYTFQQDSAPAHKAKIVQEFCRQNLYHFWPADV